VRATISTAASVCLLVFLTLACCAASVFGPCWPAIGAEGVSSPVGDKKAAPVGDNKAAEPPAAPADKHKTETPEASHAKNNLADKPSTPKPAQQAPEHAALEKLGEPTADERAREKLHRPVNVSFAETPLADAVEIIAEATGCQMFLDRRGLAEAGIEADVPVNIRLQEVPAEMVLGLMLGQLGLDYYIKHGVIVVTTAEKAVADLEVRVYPVQDLIEPIGLTRRSPDTEASRLTDVIQSSVEPESWQDNGGRGTIRYYRGTLVVLQTAKVHRAVERLLSELRQATKHAVETEPPAKQAPLPKDEPPVEKEPPHEAPEEPGK